MRVLLINTNRLKNPPVIPTGLCYIASAVEEAGHDVGILDLCFSSHPASEIEKTIKNYEPDVVGVSIRNIDTCSAANPEFLVEDIRDNIIGPLKKVFSGPIVIGGSAVGISGAEILDYLDLKYGIAGDGEQPMAEFVRRLEEGKPFGGVQGLIVRENGRIVEENKPSRPQDPDLLPLPKAWRYVDLKPYHRFESPIQVQTKRGCELSCTYCTYNVIEGKKYRLRDPRKVAAEIELLVRATGVRHIEFTDSTFNIPLNHAKAVLRAIIDLNLNVKLRTMGMNPSAVDEELAELMSKAGFRDVDLGIEACDNKMLRALGKNFTVKDIARSAKILQQKRIPLRFFLLLGAPGETPATLKKTFTELNEIIGPWDFATIGMGLRVYKGSPIADRLMKEDPEITKDNYLRPYFLTPKEMEMSELRRVVRAEISGHPNYHVNEDDRKFANPVLRMAVIKLMKLFAPRQPAWRAYIFVQKMKAILGILALEEALLERESRRRPSIGPS